MIFGGSRQVTLIPVQVAKNWLPVEVVQRLSVIFRTPVAVRPMDFDLDPFLDPVRNQVHSTAILKHFIASDPEPPGKVCLIVEPDLFIPILTFVFGEAHMNGRYCIVSGFRLKEAFYMRKEQPGLFRERLLKEIVHELGHTFGLTHCMDELCVMHNSLNIEDTDRKEIFPCSSCFEALDAALARRW